MASVFVDGLIDTPERLESRPGIGDIGSGSGRYIVAGDTRYDPDQDKEVHVPYTHVQVRSRIYGSDSSGSFPGGWKARFLQVEEIPELLSSVSGGEDEVIRYQGPPIDAVLNFGIHYGSLEFLGSDDVKIDALWSGSAPFRGTVRIPGPGLLQVRGHDWSVTLKPANQARVRS